MPIFHNFNENFPKKFTEFFAKIWGKCRNMHLYGARRAEPPEAHEFIKKWSIKQWKPRIFEIFHKLRKKT